MSEISEIIERVTEHYEVPIRLGSRCEANVYYRVEELSEEDLAVCGDYVSERVSKVCQPPLPELIINLHHSYTGLAHVLANLLAPAGETLDIIDYDKLNPGNGHGVRLKNTPVLIVNDVITTARTCLEAHTKVTMAGAKVLCWAALIDRTFGPGPVPIVTAVTGEPVTLLENLP